MFETNRQTAAFLFLITVNDTTMTDIYEPEKSLSCVPKVNHLAVKGKQTGKIKLWAFLCTLI